MEQTTLFQRESRSHNGYQTNFLEFWDAYPRRIGKRKAESCYKAACLDVAKREGLSMSAARKKLLFAARAFSKQVANTNLDYIPHPATWLNQGRYDDEQEHSMRPAAPADSPKVLQSCPYCAGLGNVVVLNSQWVARVYLASPNVAHNRGAAKRWCRDNKAGPLEHGIRCSCRGTIVGRTVYNPSTNLLLGDVKLQS